MTRFLSLIICVLLVSCATRDGKGFRFPQSGDLIDSSFFFPQQFKKDHEDSIILTTTSEYFKKIGLNNLSISPAFIEVIDLLILEHLMSQLWCLFTKIQLLQLRITMD